MASEQMRARFAAELERGSKLPAKKKQTPRAPMKRGRGPARTKGIKQTSEKQAKRTAFLHGVKAERLHDQEQRGYHCEACAIIYRTWEEAWDALTLHHTVKRSKGHGYIDYADFGVDEPRLLLLVCRSCHNALESNPMFTKESA